MMISSPCPLMQMGEVGRPLKVWSKSERTATLPTERVCGPAKRPRPQGGDADISRQAETCRRAGAVRTAHRRRKTP